MKLRIISPMTQEHSVHFTMKDFERRDADEQERKYLCLF